MSRRGTSGRLAFRTGGQDFTARAADDVAELVVFEPVHRIPAAAPSPGDGPVRDDRVNRTGRHLGIDLACAMARIGRHGAGHSPKGSYDLVQGFGHARGVAFLTGDDVHIDDDARAVVHRRVLLVTWLKLPARRRGRRRQCRSDQWRTMAAASGSVTQSFLYVPLDRDRRSSGSGPSSATASRCCATRLSKLTLARIRLASMWMISPATIPLR